MLHAAARAEPSAPDRAARPAPLRVEALDPREAEPHRAAWAALCARALEPNPFLDPDFALPAAQHLALRRPTLALVWNDGAAGGPALLAVCPFANRGGIPFAPARVWSHDLAPLGVPLLDAARGAEALGALLGWAARARPRAAALLLTAVPADGPTAALLRSAAAVGGLGLAVLDAWERAALRGAGGGGLSAKGAKEARRQRRRLAEGGALVHESARRGPELHAAVERFLALEARGWKGRAGGALLLSPGRAAFARAASRLLGRRGLFRVESLTRGGEPVAAAIVLTAGPVDYLWKIAYREALARFSPGVQLVLDVTAAQRREARAFTDSCAVRDHPMIGRLWRDRIALCDLALELRPGARRRFALAVGAERARRALRGGLKRALGGLRRRRPAPA